MPPSPLQVALITFLAHVGSFVPAACARVGLCDRIFTRVASREAAAVPQSAFMIDLTQVASMLRLGTERCGCLARGRAAAGGELLMACPCSVGAPQAAACSQTFPAVWYPAIPVSFCQVHLGHSCAVVAADAVDVAPARGPPTRPRRSLLIVDEFGKGTLAADGVGLLCATLRHLAALPAPPRVVLCTHFRCGRGCACYRV